MREFLFPKHKKAGPEEEKTQAGNVTAVCVCVCVCKVQFNDGSPALRVFSDLWVSVSKGVVGWLV